MKRNPDRIVRALLASWEPVNARPSSAESTAMPAVLLEQISFAWATAEAVS